MIDLLCAKCQTKLPVAETKIGTRVFVCSKCAHPLEAPAASPPVEEPKPAGIEYSEDKTMAPDTSDIYVQEKLREAAAKRAAKSKETAEAPKKKPAQPLEPGISKGVLWGGGAAGGVLVAVVIGVAVMLSNRERPIPAVPIDPPNTDTVQGDPTPNKTPRERAPASVESLAKVLKGWPRVRA